MLSGAKEAAEEVDAMKEPADTSRAEETVSLPLPSLRDSDRFPTPTLSRCRHVFDVSAVPPLMYPVCTGSAALQPRVPSTRRFCVCWGGSAAFRCDQTPRSFFLPYTRA
jgi:hypothetical protein